MLQNFDKVRDTSLSVELLVVFAGTETVLLLHALKESFVTVECAASGLRLRSFVTAV